MTPAKSQRHLSTYVPEELGVAFANWARATDGGTAAALRRLVIQALEGAERSTGLHGATPTQATVAPRGVGRGEQVGVRLKASERAALAAAAQAHGTSPANWIRSLALVHLNRRPQWNAAELDALRDVFRELRSIGRRIEGMDQVLGTVAQAGQGPAEEGDALREVAQQVRWEMRRVVAVMSGNFDYWGLPDAERPTAAPGALERAEAQVRAAKDERKRRPRRRPTRFADGA